MSTNSENDELIKKVRLNIEKCKLDLMMRPNTTFFSSLLSNLELHIDNYVSTAGTDGVYLWINPNFAMQQTLPKLLGLILHEVMHVAYEHPLMYSVKEYPNLDQNILNIAQDHYINIPLITGGYELPDGGYHDFKYRDLSSMEIYNLLLKNPPPNSSSFIRDVIAPPAGKENEHREEVLSNITKAVMQAELMNDYGSIPGEISRRLKEALNPKLPWEVILQNYLSSYAEEDYSWSRPNRRFQPDYFLPRLYSEGLDQIIVGMDVSGSMSQKDINEIGSELKYIHDDMKPNKLKLMTFDTRVHLNETFYDEFNPEDIKLKGGGGTNVEPLIKMIKEDNPEFALIFTDGYFSMPDMSGVSSDIFWIIKNNPNFTAPLGTVIPFD